MTRHIVTLQLPAAFIERCRHDGVTPQDVLRGFIADLCDSDAGSDVCFLAQEYYALAIDARRIAAGAASWDRL